LGFGLVFFGGVYGGPGGGVYDQVWPGLGQVIGYGLFTGQVELCSARGGYRAQGERVLWSSKPTWPVLPRSRMFISRPFFATETISEEHGKKMKDVFFTSVFFRGVCG
jgi:hypothetical protein